MYLPSLFSERDTARILDLIAAHPLATLITAHAGDPCISHLPLIATLRDGQIQLNGHLAKANPQASAIEGADCLAIFHGPDAYISPTGYETAGVPTWNYAVVHLRGPARLIDDEAALENLLAAHTAHFEAEEEAPWEFRLDDSQRQRLLGAIIGIEITVVALEAKFKLSQNRSKNERATIQSRLATTAPALARLMEEAAADR